MTGAEGKTPTGASEHSQSHVGNALGHVAMIELGTESSATSS